MLVLAVCLVVVVVIDLQNTLHIHGDLLSEKTRKCQGIVRMPGKSYGKCPGEKRENSVRENCCNSMATPGCRSILIVLVSFMF